MWIRKAVEGLNELMKYSYDTMCLIHSPPHRSLNFGGSGIAYACWKAACLLDSPEWLNQARAMIDQVAAAEEDRSHVKIPLHEEMSFDVQVQDSFFFGNRGLWFMQAMIGHSEDNPRLYEKGLKSFMSPETQRSEHQELLQGIAGRLIGCTLLLHQTGDTRLKEFGDSLAGDLLATANSPNMDGLPWSDNHLLGMAHGRAGNYYALLRWADETGYPLPEWVHKGLRRFARSGIPRERGISWPIDERKKDRFMNSWCNGAPGLILLWSIAYKIYGETQFFKSAMAAGEYCIHESKYVYGHLCCGAAGAGYAMICLNRMDPDGPWLGHALRYGEQAYEGMMVIHWRLSLFQGLAGVICFLLDLENPVEARFPLLEG
jgi:hypothetical protein